MMKFPKTRPSEALLHFASDKVDFTPWHHVHHYGAFYDEMFGSLKGPLSILEIGVLYGQSLMAWRAAFPDASITGIDLQGAGIDDSYNVKFIKSDIKNVKLTGYYDVIIDDSSHDLKESTYIVENFCKNLTEQGVLIIEDIQIPDLYIDELTKVLPKGLKLEWHDFRHLSEGRKHDDYIIKITRE